MTAKMHRVHFPKVGEAVLHIDSGTPYEYDDEEKYPVGTYARFGRKGFVYARAGASYPCLCHLGAKTSRMQTIEEVAIQADALIHATEIKLTSNISCTEDELVGGEVVVFPGGNTPFTRGIVGNDAMTATATLTLQLDGPIPIAIDTDATAQVIVNPYANVGIHSSEWNMVMGMPVITIPALKWGWLQVEGLAWCALSADVGVDVNQQNVVFCGDGSLRLASVSGYEDGQLAGVIVVGNAAATGVGAPFIMLQIAH